MRSVDYVFGLLIAGLIINVLVNGKNTSSVIQAAGGSISQVFGTVTKSN